MTPAWMERTRRVQEEVRWLLACGYIDRAEANQMLRADSTDPSKYRGQNTSMYITDENVLSVGLVDELGNEPDDPMYARQPIALRWDPSNDEEVFVNVQTITFPQCTRSWKILAARVFVNRTNVHLLDINVHGAPWGFNTGDVMGFAARELSFRRDALVNKFGDYRLHLAVTEKRPVNRSEDRLINDELILEWPRRQRRQAVRELLDREYPCEYMGVPSRGEPAGNPLLDLYKRRYGDYVPIAEQDRMIADQLAQKEALERANRAFEERNRFLAAQAERVGGINAATGELFGITNAQDANPWKMPLTNTPLTKGNIMEALKRTTGIDVKTDESMPKNQAEIRAYSDQAPYGELIPGRKLVITNIGAEQKPKPAERKIVVPVPRFWGQLDQALNEPKKAAPPKEMPVVEPTPAGAEELIDWARADESRAAWAEKLSIPRVTRMLKEMTSYGKTWSESDLCALAGG